MSTARSACSASRVISSEVPGRFHLIDGVAHCIPDEAGSRVRRLGERLRAGSGDRMGGAGQRRPSPPTPRPARGTAGPDLRRHTPVSAPPTGSSMPSTNTRATARSPGWTTALRRELPCLGARGGAPPRYSSPLRAGQRASRRPTSRPCWTGLTRSRAGSRLRSQWRTRSPIIFLGVVLKIPVRAACSTSSGGRSMRSPRSRRPRRAPRTHHFRRSAPIRGGPRKPRAAAHMHPTRSRCPTARPAVASGCRRRRSRSAPPPAAGTAAGPRSGSRRLPSTFVRGRRRPCAADGLGRAWLHPPVSAIRQRPDHRVRLFLDPAACVKSCGP